MAKITNIYITCGHDGIKTMNHVFLEVNDNGKIIFIESTKHGYNKFDHKRIINDEIYLLEHLSKEGNIDLLKNEAKTYRVYTDGMNKAIFLDATIADARFPFKQIVFIEPNKSVGTNHIFGGDGIKAPINQTFKPTYKVISKKCLIKDVFKELKVCFPELKITLKETRQNINE